MKGKESIMSTEIHDFTGKRVTIALREEEYIMLINYLNEHRIKNIDDERGSQLMRVIDRRRRHKE
jgi:hypothetical protein